MQIADVRFHRLRHQLVERYGDANGLKNERTSFVVRLETGEGIVGWGEFFGRDINHSHLSTAEDQLIGQNPLAADPLVERLQKVGMRLAAGVEIALWDIRGKAAGMSLATLLGGAYRDAQPAYASHQNVCDTADVTAKAVDEATASIDQGYRALKMKIGWHPPAVDLVWIKRVLEVLPPEVPLAIDANRALDLATARSLCRLIESPERIAWFEEPLARTHSRPYAELRQASEIPIAGGEIMDMPQLRAVIANREMDIINPDLVGHGGLRPMRHLLELCATTGVRLVPHVFDGQIIRVATLHLLAAQPDWSARQSWFSAIPLECDVSPNPLRDELLETPLQLNAEGQVPVPDGPGLGVAVNEEVLRRYRVS